VCAVRAVQETAECCRGGEFLRLRIASSFSVFSLLVPRSIQPEQISETRWPSTRGAQSKRYKKKEAIAASSFYFGGFSARRAATTAEKK
jgi:hypothetical protein